MSKSNETVRLLRKARGLIRKGWVQGEDALNRQGDAVPPSSPSAVRFCAWGAIDGATDMQPSFELRFEARQILSRAIKRITHKGRVSITSFNDSPRRTQEEVLEAFTVAIELAQTEDSR